MGKMQISVVQRWQLFLLLLLLIFADEETEATESLSNWSAVTVMEW